MDFKWSKNWILLTFIAAFFLFASTTVCYSGWWSRTVNEAVNRLSSRSSNASSNSTSLTDSEVVQGLKEALLVSVRKAVSTLSKKGGFWKNPEVRIPLPDKLDKVAYMLRMFGYGDKVEAFEKAMNEAAEDAVKEAFPVFLKAVKKLTFEDAMRILKGGDHAATDYFRKNTWDELYAKFRPIVDRAMVKTEVVSAYEYMASVPKAKLLLKEAGFDVSSLDDYITQKALDGLFKVLASEEEKIRKDPAARVSDILKKVFQ